MKKKKKSLITSWKTKKKKDFDNQLTDTYEEVDHQLNDPEEEEEEGSWPAALLSKTGDVRDGEPAIDKRYVIITARLKRPITVQQLLWK